MRYKLLIGLLLTLGALPGLAQAPVGSPPAAPDSPAPDPDWLTVFFDSPATALPLLTAAAIRHSAQVRTLELEKSINEQDIKIGKNSLLSTLALSSSYSYGNLSSIVLVDPNNPNQFSTYSSSRYSTGINFALPLDRVMSRGALLKKDELAYQRTESMRQERLSIVRQQVIQLYQGVALARQLLTLRQEAFVNVQTGYQLAEKEFRLGQLSLPALALVTSQLSEGALAQAAARNQYDTAFMLLEELVGARISSLIIPTR